MSTMWVTTLTFATPLNEDALVELGEQFEQIDGSVAALPGTGFTVTLWDDQAPAPIAAAHDATAMAAKMAPGLLEDPIGIETVSADEHVARADRATLPELMSAAEVAELLGVTRQRVHQLQHTAAFPTPLFELRTGKIWAADAVEKFAREWTRTPGRPKKTA